ncbi:MAG: DUF3515 family protein, partial [Mycobacteriales bacterium]
MSANRAASDRPVAEGTAEDAKRRLPLSMLFVVGLSAALVLSLGVAGLMLGSAGQTRPVAPTATGGKSQDGPVPLVPVDAPGANSPGCTALLARLSGPLPSSDSMLPRRQLAAPAPAATAAWGTTLGD